MDDYPVRERNLGTSEVAQQVNCLPPALMAWAEFPRTHTVEERTASLKVFSDFHTYTMTHTHTPQINTHLKKALGNFEKKGGNAALYKAHFHLCVLLPRTRYIYDILLFLSLPVGKTTHWRWRYMAYLLRDEDKRKLTVPGSSVNSPQVLSLWCVNQNQDPPWHVVSPRHKKARPKKVNKLFREPRC